MANFFGIFVPQFTHRYQRIEHTDYSIEDSDRARIAKMFAAIGRLEIIPRIRTEASGLDAGEE